MGYKMALREKTSILLQDGKHGNYQKLPPFVVEKEPRLAKLTGSARVDDRRYDWLRSHWDQSDITVTDIGANMGYFSFRMAHDYRATVYAYEPYAKHAEALETIREVAEIPASQYMIRPLPVGLDDVCGLPNVDMTIFLNVIQHAGEDFDSEIVRCIDDWWDYAKEYLTRLRTTTRHLFFQMGYTWAGHKGKLCPDDEILDFTAKLLVASGWKIKYCGVIETLEPPIAYRDFPISSKRGNTVPLLTGPGPSIWRRLERRISHAFGNGSSELTLRFAQRPIWLCEA